MLALKSFTNYFHMNHNVIKVKGILMPHSSSIEQKGHRIPASFYKASIMLTPKPEKDGIKKEKHKAILFKPRLKNLRI